MNAPPQATHWPSIHKAYDHAAIAKGFKDREFDQKERVDMEALKMALAFVQKQVQEKRSKLELLERQSNHSRFSVRHSKNSVIQYQD